MPIRLPALDHEAFVYAAQLQPAGLRTNGVLIDITHCGIYNSDLHNARNDWGHTIYPVVPGYEIVGTVRAVGNEAGLHKVGDRVAIGCMVDACMHCDHCEAGLEQCCMTGTDNGKDRQDGSITFGGYSDQIVCREDFVPKGEKATPVVYEGRSRNQFGLVTFEWLVEGSQK
ncbi:alcohol dehydrogenase catalytic domain-containing protein [Pseudopontixanthobacter vadosimaris]|uniref:alcohol dehydrogenase catalytic domain-containing protein n=1 Tax=Pseudopontixanthobacter vadosimaris TaxID=2726450 RepID=UPI0014734EF9